MNIKRYEDCVTRLENRGSHPPTRQYVDELARGVQAAGVEACWHSAVDPLGRALFPSKVYPHCHEQASLESFRYLLDSLHAIGRPVLSWYPLNLCRGVLDEHPDWVMKFLPMEGWKDNPEMARHYCCINSPYGTLLPQFAAEVVQDVGFDGLWFDGSTMANHNAGFQAGCGCEFCRQRFRRDTGLSLPDVLDLERRDVRLWINWRYDVFMEVWRNIVGAVHGVRPEATVAFNNYRRRSPCPMGWSTAIPLRRLGLDALMSGELDSFPTQGDFQMKMHRAYDCGRGQETWWPLCDHGHVWVPDVDELPAVQATIACMSAGGAACTGVGVAASLMAPSLAAMQKAGESLAAYRDGRTVEYAAIWCSQQTQDFYRPHATAGAFNQMHGANELCLGAHVQSSVIFDDHVAAGDLSQYPVILAANSICVSDEQARRLGQYVRAGGVLVACREAGFCDELGYDRPRPVLDELLGITSRRVGKGSGTLLFGPQGLLAACGYGLSYNGYIAVVQPAEDCEVLAAVADRVAGSWDGIESGAPPFERHAGLWRRRVGKGWVIYCAMDLFWGHLVEPTSRAVKLFAALLFGIAPPPVCLQAPLCVTMNSRRPADGRLAVIAHNAPGTAFRYPSPASGHYIHSVGEVVPVHDVAVRLHGMRCSKAVSGLDGRALECRDGGATVIIPRMHTHEVALLDVQDGRPG